jgi:hypothetical protein
MTESKLIPALDCQQIEGTVDKLGFTLHLAPSADPDEFEEAILAVQKMERKSSLLKKFNPFSRDDSDEEDVWPMNFESEHVGKILELFRKV